MSVPLNDLKLWVFLGVVILLTLAANQVPALARALRRTGSNENAKPAAKIQPSGSGGDFPRLRDLYAATFCHYILPPLAVFLGSSYLGILGIGLISVVGMSGRQRRAAIPH